MKFSFLRRRRKQQKHLKNHDQRALRLENLETRCLLAANFLGLTDYAMSAYVKRLDADGSISRNDMIAIFRRVQNESDGVVDATDLNDLRRIVNNSATLGMKNYVKVLATDVVYSNPANGTYQGAAMGNLAVGSSNAHLGNLVNKWFLGTDLPVTEGYSYTTAAGSLFGSYGPSHYQEQQGYLGDCYFISAMGSLADVKKTAVRNMFIGNGDGTWTVRFYYNGRADFVTVNRQLPVMSNGAFIFNGYGRSAWSSSNVLWLNLLEKAYTQWNETGRTGRGVPYNEYGAIEGGWMGDVYRQALGYVSRNYMWTGTYGAKATLISALNNHQAVTIGTVSSPNFENTGLYGNHAYNVLSYSSATGRFTLYNPWGCCHPYTLTWSQLSANCDFFSSTASPRGVNRSFGVGAAMMAQGETQTLTRSIAVDVAMRPSFELRIAEAVTPAGVAPAAADAVFATWDAPERVSTYAGAHSESLAGRVDAVATLSSAASQSPRRDVDATALSADSTFADLDVNFESVAASAALTL